MKKRIIIQLAIDAEFVGKELTPQQVEEIQTKAAEFHKQMEQYAFVRMGLWDDTGAIL